MRNRRQTKLYKLSKLLILRQIPYLLRKFIFALRNHHLRLKFCLLFIERAFEDLYRILIEDSHFLVETMIGLPLLSVHDTHCSVDDVQLKLSISDTFSLISLKDF